MCQIATDESPTKIIAIEKVGTKYLRHSNSKSQLKSFC